MSVYTVQYAVCSVEYTLSSMHCALHCTAQCAVYSTNFTIGYKVASLGVFVPAAVTEAITGVFLPEGGGMEGRGGYTFRLIY